MDKCKNTQYIQRNSKWPNKLVNVKNINDHINPNKDGIKFDFKQDGKDMNKNEIKKRKLNWLIQKSKTKKKNELWESKENHWRDP